MQITVSGKQVDVGDALRTHIEARLDEGINKYLDKVTSLNVVVSRESHLFRVDIHGNVETNNNVIIKSRAEGSDPYAAFDASADKIEKQLRRYKRRLTNHNRAERGHAVDILTEPVSAKARKYVLASSEEESDEEASKDTPLVVAEKHMNIDTLTVSEAVMRMDLADLPALMFFNSGTGRINVVYRRVDGNISWVDPEEVSATAKVA